MGPLRGALRLQLIGFREYGKFRGGLLGPSSRNSKRVEVSCMCWKARSRSCEDSPVPQCKDNVVEALAGVCLERFYLHGVACTEGLINRQEYSPSLNFSKTEGCRGTQTSSGDCIGCIGDARAPRMGACWTWQSRCHQCLHDKRFSSPRDLTV